MKDHHFCLGCALDRYPSLGTALLATGLAAIVFGAMALVFPPWRNIWVGCAFGTGLGTFLGGVITRFLTHKIDPTFNG